MSASPEQMHSAETFDEVTILTAPANILLRTLDLDRHPFVEGNALPCAWHWLHFLQVPPTAALGVDGRGSGSDIVPRRDGLNRMWAGGQFHIDTPMRFGERVERQSRLASLQNKTGKAGPMTLATVEHRYSCAGAVRLFEVQDIVFTPQVRYEPRPGTRAERPAEWHRVLAPSQVLLFRFSALTFNAHRIHYDHPYATTVEGYPGLLVHGPLTCILLLSHLAERFPERALASFTYRARRPAFEGRRITLCGASSGADGAELWAEDEDGFAVMTADARFGKIGP